eukprot:2767724-Rhodomonas_salina.13
MVREGVDGGEVGTYRQVLSLPWTTRIGMRFCDAQCGSRQSRPLGTSSGFDGAGYAPLGADIRVGYAPLGADTRV